MLAKEAQRFAHLHNYFSPFSKSALEYGLDYKGGKVDDITVIVAQIFLADHK